MKILTSLLFCLASIVSYAQNELVQNAMSLNPPGSENGLDTSNMYRSRYGPVARLTQDNMPCILPYAPATPIPNAAKRRPAPDKIPNFWKGEPWKYRLKPNKYLPVPKVSFQPKNFKALGVGKKEIPTTNPFVDNKSKLKFYMDRIK